MDRKLLKTGIRERLNQLKADRANVDYRAKKSKNSDYIMAMNKLSKILSFTIWELEGKL